MYILHHSYTNFLKLRTDTGFVFFKFVMIKGTTLIAFRVQRGQKPPRDGIIIAPDFNPGNEEKHG